MKRLRSTFFTRQCKFSIVLLEKSRLHETFPGELYCRSIFHASPLCKAYILRQPGAVLSRSVLSFSFRSVLSFTPLVFLFLFSLSFSFRSELYRGSLIAVAYRKGRFCTRVTGNTLLTPSIKVSGVVTGMSFFMARPYAKDMILSSLP